VIVTAPASSANLGPGFDSLGLALELPFELASDAAPGEGWLGLEPTHPAAVAHAEAGGDAGRPLWWRSPIPPGRGLGFSGAARVAGAYLAGRLDELDHDSACEGALRVATRLEGHPDNAAASALGSLTVAAGTHAVSLACPGGLSVLAWWPERSTSTDASRRVLPEQVALEVAAASIGHAGLWVAAIATHRLDLLRVASEDVLHQPARLAARPDAAAAMEAMLAEPQVLAAWLSGSGPTVAALVASSADLSALELGLGATGRTRRLAVSAEGVRVVPGNS
jgi:homoserine kinase